MIGLRSRFIVAYYNGPDGFIQGDVGQVDGKCVWYSDDVCYSCDMYHVMPDNFLAESWLMGSTCAGKIKEKG